MHRPTFGPGPFRRAAAGGRSFRGRWAARLPRGRDGAGAAGGGVRAPCDTAPKMSAPRCYPLHFFRAATWQSLPSNASRDLAPPRPRRLWSLFPTLYWLANAMRGCDANINKAHTGGGLTRRVLCRHPHHPSLACVTRSRARGTASGIPLRPAWASLNLAATLTEPRILFAAAAQPAINSATRFSTSEASPPNCLKSAGRMRSTNGTHTLSRAAAITDSRRGLHSARALRIAARWSHGPLLPTHFVIDCWQRPRTQSRRVWMSASPGSC